MSYSRTRGTIIASEGFGIGSKGTETMVVSSAGKVISGARESQSLSFASASTAQTLYTIAPFAANVVAVYETKDGATQKAPYTIKAGSAGSTIASVTATSGSAGTVSTMTLGTVAVTAGQSISVVRAAAGTTGSSVVTIVYERTS